MYNSLAILKMIFLLKVAILTRAHQVAEESRSYLFSKTLFSRPFSLLSNMSFEKGKIKDPHISPLIVVTLKSSPSAPLNLMQPKELVVVVVVVHGEHVFRKTHRCARIAFVHGGAARIFIIGLF